MESVVGSGSGSGSQKSGMNPNKKPVSKADSRQNQRPALERMKESVSTRPEKGMNGNGYGVLTERERLGEARAEARII